ncbi:MAG: hypothetical protein ACETVR_03495 [Candidatus Bathyarchaeia archaeon]
MKRLKGTLEALRRVKNRGTRLRVCPSCGKSNIRPEGSLGFGVLPVIYICKDCGYRGHLIIEVDKEDYENRRKVK